MIAFRSNPTVARAFLDAVTGSDTEQTWPAAALARLSVYAPHAVAWQGSDDLDADGMPMAVGIVLDASAGNALTGRPTDPADAYRRYAGCLPGVRRIDAAIEFAHDYRPVVVKAIHESICAWTLGIDYRVEYDADGVVVHGRCADLIPFAAGLSVPIVARSVLPLRLVDPAVLRAATWLLERPWTTTPPDGLPWHDGGTDRVQLWDANWYLAGLEPHPVPMEGRPFSAPLPVPALLAGRAAIGRARPALDHLGVSDWFRWFAAELRLRVWIPNDDAATASVFIESLTIMTAAAIGACERAGYCGHDLDAVRVHLDDYSRYRRIPDLWHDDGPTYGPAA